MKRHLPVISPSQAKNAAECLRKWAFKSLYKQPDPPGPAARFGTDCHTTLEVYIKHGISPNIDTRAGRVIIAALPHLPAPQSVRAEGRFRSRIDGVDWQGILDMDAPHPTHPWFGDLKTTGNPRFALTTETLPYDIQCLTYARRSLDHSPQAPQVTARWVYVTTNTRPKSWRVEVSLPRDFVVDNFDRTVQPIARLLVDLNQTRPHPLNLPANYQACGKYGGCPYKQWCPDATPEAAFVQMTKGAYDIMTLLDEARKAMPGAPPFALPNTPGPAPQVDPLETCPPNVQPAFHSQLLAWGASSGKTATQAYQDCLAAQGGKLTGATQLIDVNGPADPFAAPETAPLPPPQMELPNTGFTSINSPEAPVDVPAAANPQTGAQVDVTPQPVKVPETKAKPTKLTAAQAKTRDAIFASNVKIDMPEGAIESVYEWACDVARRLV